MSKTKDLIDVRVKSLKRLRLDQLEALGLYLAIKEPSLAASLKKGFALARSEDGGDEPTPDPGADSPLE